MSSFKLTNKSCSISAKNSTNIKNLKYEIIQFDKFRKTECLI
jgi:hypothetical protein